MVINGPRTLVEAVLERAGATPSDLALLAPGRTPCSYLALRDQMQRTADRLASVGIERSDAVVTVLPNGPEMAAAFVGVMAAGVCAPLNPAYTETEVGFYLDDLGARAVIVSADAAPAIRASAARGLPVLELQPISDGPAGTFTLAPARREVGVVDGVGARRLSAPPHAGRRRRVTRRVS